MAAYELRRVHHFGGVCRVLLKEQSLDCQNQLYACPFVSFGRFFFAWRDEHRKVNALEEQLAQAKEDYFDARPQMGISVLSELGTKGWNESIDSNNASVRFFIQHLNGRVPTSVRFDPVPSKNGRFSLRFEVLPHVDPPVWKAMNFEILEVGNFPQPALIEGMVRGKMMLRFVQDSPPELSQFEYPLTIRFKDRQGEERTQLFH